jgi:hypothetical protein
MSRKDDPQRNEAVLRTFPGRQRYFGRIRMNTSRRHSATSLLSRSSA